jgi:hypothetical protein
MEKRNVAANRMDNTMQRALDRSELFANESMIAIQRNLCSKQRLFKAALFSEHEFTESQLT